MNCEEIAQNEIAEQYVAGRLGEAARDAYEVHFFECSACLDHLQLLEAIRTNLASRPVLVLAAQRRPQVYYSPRWLAAAAMLVLLSGIAWWNLRRVNTPAPVALAQTQAPASIIPPKASPDAIFDQLARVDAPAYHEPSMRGSNEAADTQFRAAMRHYQHQDYAGAIPGLTEAARLNPKSSATQFFLGVSYLLNADRANAIAHLRIVAAREDSLEAGDAHFYLGQALLGEHDPEGAAAEFKKAIAAQSERTADATRIIDAIRGVR